MFVIHVYNKFNLKKDAYQEWTEIMWGGGLMLSQAKDICPVFMCYTAEILLAEHQAQVR